MAALDLQEQEQLDALKAWWRDNGKGVILLVVVAVVAVALSQVWRAYQTGQAGEAAELYGELNKQFASGDPKRINDAAAVLTDKYSSSPFAPRAALLAAGVNIEKQDAARAKTQLQWVIEHTKEDTLQNLAHLKLAALLLDQKDYAGALAQLEGKHPESFDSLYDDLKGDVLSAQGKNAEARAAYQRAHGKADANGPYRNLIQMKLDALGEPK